jgi:ubiquinone/menaquinone biosynthesis C-methylase UbiE
VGASTTTDQQSSFSLKASMDVNDWIESSLKWEPALPLINKVVFPYLQNDFRVCEIGSGTGRHARHIIPLIKEGELHLYDHSSWIKNYLNTYFSDYSNVYIHHSDGIGISAESEFFDLCFSNGTFIELKLGTIYLYAKEFFRVLKKNGYAIFDYLDIQTEEGYKFLESQSLVHHKTFTYHCTDAIDQVFTSMGFILIKRYQEGKSTYVVYQKIK